jgi:hypothetical protein
VAAAHPHHGQRGTRFTLRHCAKVCLRLALDGKRWTRRYGPAMTS